MISHPTGQSLLEGKSIADATRKDYRQRLVDFVTWCIERKLDWMTDEQLDMIIITSLGEMFFKGE
eukprot:7875936-Karenia_brevis.AAC.1